MTLFLAAMRELFCHQLKYLSCHLGSMERHMGSSLLGRDRFFCLTQIGVSDRPGLCAAICRSPLEIECHAFGGASCQPEEGDVQLSNPG